LHGAEQFGELDGLAQVLREPRVAQRGLVVDRVAGHRDPAYAVTRAQLAHQLEPVAAVQADVGDDDVRGRPFGGGEGGVVAAGRLDLKIARQQPREEVARVGAVVDQQQAAART
jgi:hypothetical protein